VADGRRVGAARDEPGDVGDSIYDSACLLDEITIY
jgi:hypothetical protein